MFVWNVVAAKDFCSHEIDKRILTHVVEKPADTKQVVRTAPQIQTVESAGNIRVEKKIVTREKVNTGNREIERPK